MKLKVDLRQDDSFTLSRSKSVDFDGSSVNIALWNRDKNQYYIASIRRHANEPNWYVVVGKRINGDGRIEYIYHDQIPYKTEGEALKRCRRMVLMKQKHRMDRYTRVALEKLPLEVQNHLEVPIEMQMTAREMVEYIAMLKNQVTVIFSDASGIEDKFDIGVEYLGYKTEDPDILIVHDKYGEKIGCSRSRLSSVLPIVP